MPRPNQVSTTERYKKLNDVSIALKEQRDCSVIALAAVTGVSYNEAHLAMEKHGRKYRHGAWTMDLWRALEDLGFDWTAIELEYFISNYPKPHARLLQNVTTHHPDRFPEVWTDGYTYLLHSTKHFSAVVDGVPHDFSRNRKRRVHSIYRIIPLAKVAAS